MVDPAFQREVAEEHARGICDYFGVPFVETPSKIDAYKEHIQKKCQFSDPDNVWELLDKHKYAEILYQKFAEAMK